VRKERLSGNCTLVKEMEQVSGTYFTSIAQDITEDKYAVKSYLPVQQKQVPARLQDSHV
jgi:hypothetical protein